MEAGVTRGNGNQLALFGVFFHDKRTFARYDLESQKGHLQRPSPPSHADLFRDPRGGNPAAVACSRPTARLASRFSPWYHSRIPLRSKNPGENEGVF